MAMFNVSKTQSQGKSVKSNIILVIDMGSAHLRMLAAEVNAEGHINVLGYKECESAGMNCGAVSDLSLLSDKLSMLVQDFDSEYDVPLNNLTIGIAGRHIESRNEHGTTTVQSRVVTIMDRDKAIENAKSVRFTEGSHIIHVVPQNYEVEGFNDISNPIGLYAMRLDVCVHLISCNRDQENNLRAAIEKISPNFKIDSVIYNGLAASSAVLSDAEREIGVCLIDIGAGTSNIAVYENKKLVLTFGLNRGGDVITKAIASYFGIPISVAEQLKIMYGKAHTDLLTQEEINMRFNVPINLGDGRQENIEVGVYQLTSVISYCLLDLLRSISDKIESMSREMNKTISLGAGFVLTGGVAQTKGMDICAAAFLAPRSYQSGSPNRVKVKIGLPRAVTGPDSICTADKAVILGLARYANQERSMERDTTESEPSGKIKTVVKKMKDWFSREF